MKRMILAAVVVALSALAPARADDAAAPLFFLRPDGTVEQRVAAVESDVAKLRAEVAALKAELRGESPVAAKAAAPKAATAPATPAKVRYQQCVNGRCTIYEVDAGTPIPFGATLLASGTTASAAPAVSNCPGGVCLPIRAGILGRRR
jgi:outer membrane murein-binding lipoprotein Lpp